eukprot:TRINITY_DN26045_c0_g2_i1.p1 TRINITY_DN26045_c0_g2~~TRINITY_DN26045_c0_g2_i1.p1  ORF type:complete len:1566 (-),score=317.05 TRINITY_DN26045_c0_g2_i1:65-4447(-)
MDPWMVEALMLIAHGYTHGERGELVSPRCLGLLATRLGLKNSDPGLAAALFHNDFRENDAVVVARALGLSEKVLLHLVSASRGSVEGWVALHLCLRHGVRLSTPHGTFAHDTTSKVMSISGPFDVPRNGETMVQKEERCFLEACVELDRLAGRKAIEIGTIPSDHTRVDLSMADQVREMRRLLEAVVCKLTDKNTTDLDPLMFDIVQIVLHALCGEPSAAVGVLTSSSLVRQELGLGEVQLERLAALMELVGPGTTVTSEKVAVWCEKLKEPVLATFRARLKAAVPTDRTKLDANFFKGNAACSTEQSRGISSPRRRHKSTRNRTDRLDDHQLERRIEFFVDLLLGMARQDSEGVIRIIERVVMEVIEEKSMAGASTLRQALREGPSDPRLVREIISDGDVRTWFFLQSLNTLRRVQASHKGVAQQLGAMSRQLADQAQDCGSLLMDTMNNAAVAFVDAGKYAAANASDAAHGLADHGVDAAYGLVNDAAAYAADAANGLADHAVDAAYALASDAAAHATDAAESLVDHTVVAAYSHRSLACDAAAYVASEAANGLASAAEENAIANGLDAAGQVIQEARNFVSVESGRPQSLTDSEEHLATQVVIDIEGSNDHGDVVPGVADRLDTTASALASTRSQSSIEVLGDLAAAAAAPPVPGITDVPVPIQVGGQPPFDDEGSPASCALETKLEEQEKRLNEEALNLLQWFFIAAFSVHPDDAAVSDDEKDWLRDEFIPKLQRFVPLLAAASIGRWDRALLEMAEFAPPGMGENIKILVDILSLLGIDAETFRLQTSGSAESPIASFLVRRLLDVAERTEPLIGSARRHVIPDDNIFVSTAMSASAGSEDDSHGAQPPLGGLCRQGSEDDSHGAQAPFRGLGRQGSDDDSHGAQAPLRGLGRQGTLTTTRTLDKSQTFIGMETFRVRMDASGPAWMADASLKDEEVWVEFDFGEPMCVVKIQARGCIVRGHWTTRLGISVSRDGKRWTRQATSYPSNVDAASLAEFFVGARNAGLYCRYLRVHILDWHGGPSLRLEALGMTEDADALAHVVESSVNLLIQLLVGRGIRAAPDVIANLTRILVPRLEEYVASLLRRQPTLQAAARDLIVIMRELTHRHKRLGRQNVKVCLFDPIEDGPLKGMCPMRVVITTVLELLLPFLGAKTEKTLSAILRVIVELRDVAMNPRHLAKATPLIVENLATALGKPRHSVAGIVALAQGDWVGAVDFCRPFCSIDPQVLSEMVSLLPTVATTLTAATGYLDEDDTSSKVTQMALRLQKLSAEPKEAQNAANDLFEVIDEDQSGKISVEEFKLLMRRLGYCLSPHKITEVFSMCKTTVADTAVNTLEAHVAESPGLSREEFKRAMSYVEGVVIERSLLKCGLAWSSLIFYLTSLTLLLLLLFGFIFLGITSFVTGGVFNSVINSLMTITAGLGVTLKTSQADRERQDNERLSATMAHVKDSLFNEA